MSAIKAYLEERIGWVSEQTGCPDCFVMEIWNAVMETWDVEWLEDDEWDSFKSAILEGRWESELQAYYKKEIKELSELTGYSYGHLLAIWKQCQKDGASWNFFEGVTLERDW